MNDKLYELLQHANIIDTITLPNGGVIYLDSKAYDASEGATNHYDRHTNSWSTELFFRDTTISSPSEAYENTNKTYI